MPSFPEDKTMNYWAYSCATPDPYKALESHLTCDVCIIGAGFLGLTTAYFLARQGYSVVVLEKENVGWGASGRCGGQISPGFCRSVSAIEAKVGAETSRKFWDMSVEGVAGVQKIIADEEIACDLAVGGLYLATNPQEEKMLREYGQHMNTAYKHNLEFFSRQGIRQKMGTDYYCAGLHNEKAAGVNPFKYCQGLAKAVVRHGGQIYSKTEVVKIDRRNGQQEITTKNGKLSSKFTICSGGAYMGRLLPKARRKFVAARNGMIATQPLSEDLGVMPEKNTIWEIGGDHFYCKTADNRIVFGGGDGVKPENNKKATDEKIKKALFSGLTKVFPQLAQTQVDFFWAGTLCMTNTYMPNVNEIAPNIFYANGFSGHGMNTTYNVARCFEKAITQNDKQDMALFNKFSNMTLPGMGRWDSIFTRIGMMLHRSDV